MRRRILQVTTSALVGLAVVAAIVWLTPPPMSEMEWDGASAPPSPYPAPGLELPGLDGEPVNLASFRGRTTVVFFGFSNCPDVCPSTLLSLTRVLDDLSPRQADRLRVVFVTVDPERDTPERLEEWMANFHPSIVTLRGTEEEVLETAREWGVHVARAPTRTGNDDPHAHMDHGDPSLSPEVQAAVPAGAPGAYGVDHSARSFVIDRAGRVVLLLAPFQSSESMGRDLRRVLR
ncbi:MAG: SCO family protein [Gemmatimonadales bacterium]|nr:MAG: SCO family protein [Gemmatimonadales bacterium]